MVRRFGGRTLVTGHARGLSLSKARPPRRRYRDKQTAAQLKLPPDAPPVGEGRSCWREQHGVKRVKEQANVHIHVFLNSFSCPNCPQSIRAHLLSVSQQRCKNIRFINLPQRVSMVTLKEHHH